MRRACRGCGMQIKGHVWVVKNRDFCCAGCQRDFDVDPNERVLKWDKRKQRFVPVPRRWYDPQQRKERR